MYAYGLEKMYVNMLITFAVVGAVVGAGILALCLWVVPHIHFFWK